MSYSINFGITKGPLFRLVSPHELIQRRSFKIKNDPTATHTVLDPRDAYPLEGGEWVMLDPTDPETVIRPSIAAGGDAFNPAGTECASGDNLCCKRCFMTLHESGALPEQVLRQVPVAYLQGYEMETRLFLSGQTMAIGDEVYVGQVQHPNYASPVHLLAGLVPKQIADDPAATAVAVGFITKLPDDNGGWLRIMVADRL